MLHARQHDQHSLELADRRAHRRLAASSVIFVRLDERNGGTVSNLSEDGLALSAVRAVEDDELPSLRIQFPETSEWIHARAQIVWRSESKKEAGVRFVGLSEQARQQIQEWISAQGSGAEFPESTEATLAAAPPLDEVRQEIPPSVVEQVNRQLENLDVGGIHSTVGFHPRERRSRARTRIVPLGYLQLGEGNGGIALNVSEDGLAITAGGILIDDHLPCIRLLFPDTDDWIQTNGEIVWRSESKKEAGIKFTKLTEEARRQIRDWVSSQPPASEIPAPFDERNNTEANPAPADNSVPVEPPLDIATPAVAADLTPKEDAALVIPEPLALPELDLPAIVHEDAPTLENYASENRASLDTAALPEKPAFRLRELVMAGALVGFVFLLAVSFALRRHPVSRLKTDIKTEIAQKVDSGPLSPPVPSAPQPVEITAAKNPDSEPPTPADKAEIRQPSEDTPPSLVAGKAKRIPAVTAVRNPVKQTPVAPTVTMDKAARITDWGTSHPVTTAPVKSGVAISPGAPPQLPVSANASTNSPNDPLYADLARKETPAAAPKQPEAPPNRSGKVEVQADPYPSIRFAPEQKAKKGTKANSLQLGHLLSHVDPVYPEEAKQQGIEGTVKVHAVVARDGSVQRVDADGPAALLSSVKNAVRQWRYTQTLVGGQAVETDENIDVTFRLSNK